MAEKKHNFTRTEIQAGAMVLISAVVLVGFVALIQNLRPRGEEQIYYASFTDIGGLEQNAEVRFGGYLVGNVRTIQPNPDVQTEILVGAAVAPGTPINEKSVASVGQISLTAAKHLEISTGSVDGNLLPPGTVLQAVNGGGGLVDLPDMSGVIVRVQHLLDDVIEVIGVDEAQKLDKQGDQKFVKLTQIAAQVGDALDKGTGLVSDARDTLNDERPQIEEILTHVKEIEASANELVKNLDGMIAENRAPIQKSIAGIDSVIKDASGMVKQLAAELETLTAALQSTLDNTNALSGNARDFVDVNRSVIEDAILDLRETVRYLKEFSRTMAEQPQSVIRGKALEGRK